MFRADRTQMPFKAPLRSLLLGAPLLIGTGCAGKNTCDSPEEALSHCSNPLMDEAYYIEQSLLYFNTMDFNEDREVGPNYGKQVARWEWPPWLKLTAYGKEDIKESDRLLWLYESTIPERDCRAFDTQPFGRCRVTFYYSDHDGQPCPIYEEFTFNDQGEVTFIEAWSDLPGFLPMPQEDTWAEGENVKRLSSKIPGLGSATGALVDVADFRDRALDWKAAWLAELEAAGDDLWARGCGWEL